MNDMKESVYALEERVQVLEIRNQDLEHRIRLLMSLVDPDKQPFNYHMLEANASEQQVTAIYELMDKTRSDIVAKIGISHHAFEQRVYEIFPTRVGHYHFAEGIVSSPKKTRQYEVVYEHMQNDGMNI